MKRKMLVIALVVVTLAAGAQSESIPLTPGGAYERKEVIIVDSVSAAVLFDRAMIALTEWTGPNGKAKAGIDYQNQETHTVVYKGHFYAGNRKWLLTTIERMANFTVKVRCKDGRAQVTVTVSTLTGTVASNGRSKTWTIGEAIEELSKTSGKRRERGEDAMVYITGTADNIMAAMTIKLRGAEITDKEDDF